MKYKVQNQEFDDWTSAQDRAVELLNSGIEYVEVFLWSEIHNDWRLLQELNLDRGILPDPNFNTWTLAPYYVRNYYGKNKTSVTSDNF